MGVFDHALGNNKKSLTESAVTQCHSSLNHLIFIKVSDTSAFFPRIIIVFVS